MARCDLLWTPGPACLWSAALEPPAAEPVPQEAVPGAERSGWGPARRVRVSEPVQTGALELLHIPGTASVRTRVDER